MDGFADLPVGDRSTGFTENFSPFFINFPFNAKPFIQKMERFLSAVIVPSRIRLIF
jgi:hypothetical protein